MSMKTMVSASPQEWVDYYLDLGWDRVDLMQEAEHEKNICLATCGACHRKIVSNYYDEIIRILLCKIHGY